MTPEQQAELRAAARANPECAAALAARDCATLAALLSPGRTRANAREIGNGTILDTLGLAAGTAFLDVITNDAQFRYVKPLIEQGRLLIGSALVQQTVQGFAATGVLTQAQADSLCALGQEPDPVTPQEVAAALFNPDGSER
jgi:hypothetical protein